MQQKDRARLDIWQLGVESFLREPMGTGPGTFEITYRRYRTGEMMSHVYGSVVMQSHAHNIAIEALSTLGILIVIPACMLARRMRWGREAGVLAAAMGTLLFNPGSLEVYCVMALMIGRMASDEQDTPLTPWIGRLLSSVGLAVGIAYLVAEKSPWVMVRFPCEPEYSARMSEVVAVTRDGRTLAFAEENARRLTQCRPQFAPSWMVRGVIDYYGARLGASDRKHQALRSLETARILDPHHGSIHELLRAVDKLPGPR